MSRKRKRRQESRPRPRYYIHKYHGDTWAVRDWLDAKMVGGPYPYRQDAERQCQRMNSQAWQAEEQDARRALNMDGIKRFGA